MAIYALTKQIEIYDQAKDDANTKNCIQKAFTYYPSNAALNEQYANLLLYTTASSTKNNGHNFVESVDKNEYPRFFSSNCYFSL